MNALDYEKYLPYLKTVLEGSSLSSPSLYDENTYVFRIIKSSKKRLTIVLKNNDPRLYFSDDENTPSSLSSSTLDKLKREMRHPYINKVEVVKGDRIIKFSFAFINSVYKEETRYLYVELIPHHANMVITDSSGKILFVHKATSFQSPRPLSIGLIYEPPSQKETIFEDKPFSPLQYEKECLQKEKDLAATRKKERFGWLLEDNKRREKSLKRKISNLERDIAEATRRLDDGKYGDAIYTNYSSIQKGDESFIYEGETIILDPKKTVSENAEAYYKRAKKAKETLIHAEKLLEEARKGLLDAESAIVQIENADEEGLEVLSKELGLTKDKSPKKGKKDRGGLSYSSLPYETQHDGVRYLFGKNAKQNAVLTFLLETQKDHYWFHQEGESGSHLIIKKDNPSEKEMSLACELIIALNGYEDGTVMVARRDEIKSGSALGHAILGKYEVRRVNSVSKLVKELIDRAKKYEP